MPKEQALEDTESPATTDEPELDQAISDLRGVLEEDAAGSDGTVADGLPGDAPGEFSVDDLPDPFAQQDTGLEESVAPEMMDFDASGPQMAQTTGATGTVANSDIIMDIPVEVQIVLGKTQMKVSSLMKLDEGATISLDRRIGESVDIMVNGRMIGHGEITVLEEDETRFGVKLTNILGASQPTGKS